MTSQEYPPQETLAIVGIGCRFPGGADSENAFWQLLTNGVDAICDVPQDRWDTRKFYDPDKQIPGCTYTRQAGFLRESIWDFDSDFFNISPREASIMDPQQRLLLETTWEALEDANLVLTDEVRERIGVYVGAFCFDNASQQTSPLSRSAIISNTPTSASMVMLSNRISYVFDFQGPSLTVDTACSSSLVATHLAAQGILNGDCDTAVVGGVNVMLRPESTILESKGGFLSSDARCKAFDESANGYVRAEGCGVVVLKRLSTALADGSSIVALIRGTGVNQDGQTSGITVPNGDAQKALIHKVYKDAGIDPKDIDLIEAHGTGTPVGDPIEATALGEAIGQRRAADKQPAWVGSVKANIGHLEAGAGVAGLIKAALCLKHQKIPPQLHYHSTNKNIDFDTLGLRVTTTLQDVSAEPCELAAVNSFGYGGTNAHVVLQRAETITPKMVEEKSGGLLFPVSAHCQGALSDFASSLADQIEADLTHSTAAYAYAMSQQRRHFSQRALVAADDRVSLIKSLRSLSQGEHLPNVRRGKVLANSKTVWLYTGMGAQWWGMGSELYTKDKIFRTAIEECDRAWQKAGGESFLADFGAVDKKAQEYGQPMPEPKDAQPRNLALQIGLTQMLRANGVRPDAIVGHSVGEIAAAWAADVFSLEEVFRLTYHRCFLQQELAGQGTMLALQLPASDARERILSLAPDIDIAAFNDRNSVTLGGSYESLNKIATWAKENNIRASFLKVAAAYHTRQMKPIRERFLAALSDLSPSIPSLPLYSTVTGRRIESAEQNVEYWWRNAGESVFLEEALQTIAADNYRAFIEVGPHSVLGASVVTEVEDSKVWSCQRRATDEIQTFQYMLSDWYCAGGDLDWSLHYSSGDSALKLPRYPFQRQTQWRETAASRADRLIEELHPLLHQRLESPGMEWQTLLNNSFLPWLPDHRVSGSLIFPGAGYSVSALAAAMVAERSNAVEGISFEKPLSPMSQTILHTHFNESSGAVNLFSRSPEEGSTWQSHATARIPEGELFAPESLDIDELYGRCPDAVNVDEMYTLFDSIGLQYGPHFRCIKSLSSGADEVIVKLECLDEDAESYRLHPALLDASFQALLGARSDESVIDTYVPVHLGVLAVYEPIGKAINAHIVVNKRRENVIEGAIVFFREDGTVVAEARNVKCQRVQSNNEDELLANNLYAWDWQVASEAEAAETSISDSRWIVIAKGGDEPEHDVARKIKEQMNQHGVIANWVEGSNLQAMLTSAKEPIALLDLRAVNIDASDPDGRQACLALIDLVQGLPDENPVSQLTIVTGSAIPADETQVQPAAASVWGLGRVVASEYPDLNTKLIDISSPVMSVEQIIAELDNNEENEVALRADGRRFLPRLERWQADEEEFEECSLEEPVCLEVGTPGVLESLHWVPAKRRAPERGEVEIRIHNTSINFKDLMKVLNMLSDDYMDTTFIGQYLGIECSGTVIAVGEGVSDFKIGDEVIAIDTNGCFRTFHTVATGYLFHKPNALSHANAPALIAYVTAYYALRYVGRAAKGEVLLVHSASGGVGLATLQLAKWLGLTVIATAGSESKRSFLRSHGVEHVFDSRSLAFFDEVNSVTGGRGVDIVLNSLSGEAARQSLKLLAPYGRFLEIGKKDIAEGGELGLADFDRNLSYVAIDTDRMGAERPEEFRQLNAEVIALIDQGILEPIETHEIAAKDIVDAFRMMARAQHTGKISINFTSGSVTALKHKGIKIRSDRKWLITGGLGGFGLHVAKWLVQQGTRHLVLVGRSGASRPEAQAAIADMEQSGVTIDVESLSVDDLAAVTELMDRMRHDGTPLQGIIHGAMVLDDAPLSELNHARFNNVMSPKAMGAWNLHAASEGIPLEAFVLFSSVATFIGNNSQASYVAANCFLEGLAWQRQAQGLPATVVNWGAINDVGVVASNKATALYLDNIGINGLAANQCTKALGHLLETDVVQVGVVKMNWQRWITTAGPVAESAKFSRIVASVAAGSAVEKPFVADLRKLEVEERYATLVAMVAEKLAAVLHTDAEKIDPTLSLENMGVDSLMMIELVVSLKNILGIELSAMTLMTHGENIEKLCHYLLTQLFDQPEEKLDLQSIKDDTPDEALPDIDTLSEEDLDSLLKETVEG